MANTYTLISSVTVGSGGAANKQLTSIPSTYTDLVVWHSLRTTTGIYNSEDMAIDFNGSSANFSWKILRADQTSVNSTGNTNNLWSRLNEASATANTFTNNQFYIPNYASSNYKSISSESVIQTNNAARITDMNAVLWSNTAALTSITLYHRFSNTLAQYSTAYLYGISNA
jgi:hypothetical protein